MLAKTPSLQANIQRLQNYINYMYTIDFHALLRPAEDRNSSEKEAEDDKMRRLRSK